MIGDFYGIIDNMDALPVTGMFAGLDEDATFTSNFDGEAYLFEISYDGNIISPALVTFNGGNDVVLEVIGASPVSEPPSLAMLVGGLFGLAAFVWLRGGSIACQHP
jgi:hypothetical protein